MTTPALGGQQGHQIDDDHFQFCTARVRCLEYDGSLPVFDRVEHRPARWTHVDRKLVGPHPVWEQNAHFEGVSRTNDLFRDFDTSDFGHMRRDVGNQLSDQERLNPSGYGNEIRARSPMVNEHAHVAKDPGDLVSVTQEILDCQLAHTLARHDHLIFDHRRLRRDLDESLPSSRRPGSGDKHFYRELPFATLPAPASRTHPSLERIQVFHL